MEKRGREGGKKEEEEEEGHSQRTSFIHETHIFGLDSFLRLSNKEEVPKLPDGPECHLAERLLADVLVESCVELLHTVRVELAVLRHHRNHDGDKVILHIAATLGREGKVEGGREGGNLDLE